MSSSYSNSKKPGAPKPKPVAPKPAEVEVVVAEEVAAAEAEVIAAPDMDVQEEVVVAAAAPVIVEAPVVTASTAPASAYAVVSGGVVDPVHLSKIVYKNIHAKKSLSVHHLQRRLKEWGFMDAYLDKDGYYGDLTKGAVSGFQQKVGLPDTGIVDAATLKAVFENDNNVLVVID